MKNPIGRHHDFCVFLYHKSLKQATDWKCVCEIIKQFIEFEFPGDPAKKRKSATEGGRMLRIGKSKSRNIYGIFASDEEDGGIIEQLAAIVLGWADPVEI